jgi:hypothetical protein
MKLRPLIRFHNEWFLFLSPAFAVVHGACRFPEAIAWQDVVYLFLAYSLISFLLALLFQRWLTFRKAALFVFGLMLFNVVFGSIYEFITTHAGQSFIGRQAVLFVLSFALFALIFFLLKKTRFRFNRTTRFLNFLWMLLILLDVLMLAIKIGGWQQRHVATQRCDTCAKPDVYLLVTDGYAGRQQIEGYLKSENDSFYRALRQAGFAVADSSISNYSYTSASMAALLTMTYGQDKSEDPHVLINQNSVTHFFANAGFDIINHSVFKFGDQYPKQPILYFRTGIHLLTYYTFWSYFKNFIANLTHTQTVDDDLQMMQGWSEKEQGRDARTMEHLLKEAATPSNRPKFVYAHFMMPHPPLLFNANGGPADTALSTEVQYLAYLQYTNKHLLEGIEQILRSAKKPPIILLLSDHGYRNDEEPRLTPGCFSNLVAWHLPDGEKPRLYNGISTVNLFRVLLNGRFGQALPLLPDSTVQPAR